MPTFNCPSCSKKLKTPETSIGKKIACPCGTHLRVPANSNTPAKIDQRKISKPVRTETVQTQTAQTQTGQPASNSESQNIPVTCSCGKKLLAPARAVGKAVRCGCGNTVPVHAGGSPQNNVLSPPPSVFGDDEPFGPVAGYPAAPTNFTPSMPAGPAFPQPVAPANTHNQLAPPTDVQVASSYLRQAEIDTAQERYNANRGSAIAWGGIGTGLLMMFGAVIWFVLGIYLLDRYYIYPPVLFLSGIATFTGAIFFGD